MDIGRDPYTTALGRLIRSKREAMGISQTALSKLAGVSQPTVSDWENGICAPTPARLNVLLRVLSIEDHEYLRVLGKAVA